MTVVPDNPRKSRGFLIAQQKWDEREANVFISPGQGGRGPPAYGWDALGHVARDMRGTEAAFWTELPDVGKTFPFTQPWVWEAGEMSPEGTFEQRCHGIIYLGNDGCAMYSFLVVNGPERGNVWMICGEGMQPTSPKRDFLQWIEDWLDGITEWWV